MIDLSHLTEEEQGAIMTVLMRDADLKKAEEERVRKLGKILNSGSESPGKLKYLTGEWFYEAKSRRHMDKIHGSEIILASMKHKKAPGLDVSRYERSKTPSSQGSDIATPPKPARTFKTLQPQELSNVEKGRQSPTGHSPRMPRQNPFNRVSPIVVEPPENNNDGSTRRDHESPETELISPLNNPPGGDTSQTSGGSLTSEGSSAGLRPVPKRRTFLSRRTCSQSESNGPGLDSQAGPAEIVPALRQSIQQGSSGSSNQSSLKSPDEKLQSQPVSVSNREFQSAQPSSSADESSKQLLCDVSEIPSNSSLERDRNPLSSTRDRPATYTSRDGASTERENPWKGEESHDKAHGMNAVILPTSNIQDSERENSSSVGTATRQEDLSMTQSTVGTGPPVSYDLKFIDKSNQEVQKKSNQKNVFKLSTQATSPTGDEEDSIAKVLDWFSRSTDSSDWLNVEDGPAATTTSDKHVEISEVRGEDSFRNSSDSDTKKEPLQMNRGRLQTQTTEVKDFSGTDRIDNKERSERQNEVMKDTRERMQTQVLEDNDDECQPPKISDLKSFWEKNNTDPKILISKSITPNNKGQNPVHPSAENNEENMNKPHTVSDMPSGIYSGKGICKSTSNHRDGREQQLVITAQKDTGDHTDHVLKHTSAQKNNNDPTHNLIYRKLLSSPQEADSEILGLTGPHLEPSTAVQSSNLQQPSISQSRETLQQKGNHVHIPPRAQMHRSLSEDVKRRGSEDKSMQSNMSPVRKEDMSSYEIMSGVHLNREGLPEESAEKIKQLRSFWEQEMNKPLFYTDKPKAQGDGRVTHANQAKLNKRFTKSEFDLRLIGDDSCSDEVDSDRNHHNFTVSPMNERIEASSPTVCTSRTQFRILREFWDETTSQNKRSLFLEKPKSPKRKEAINVQFPSQDCGDSDFYTVSPTVENTRPPIMKSSLTLQNQSKPPQERQTGSGPRAVNDAKNYQHNYTTAESKRSSKDSNREEKSTKPQCSSRKGTRSPKSRKDSRGNSLRRTTSMFTLSVADEKDQRQLEMDVSPVRPQSRKHTQNTEKAKVLRRSSEENENVTPRARAFVPKDYRHYLGMTDKTSVQTSFSPAVKDDGSEDKCGYEFDLSSPVRSSTPLSSEERYSRKGSKMSSDTGQESSMSSTSETWSNPRHSSNWKNDDENQHPVRKALRRAEAWPKNQTKSMEDITASLSPRQERRHDTTAEMRRTSDVSSIPPHSAVLSSDPDHLKKMSKSVPSFLQEEDPDRDGDSTYEDSYSRGSSSMTNLTHSSGMASLSSLSGSVMTIYSGDLGNIEVQGNIHFSINYIQKLREFHIFVAECRDLAAADLKRGRSDPYVKSYLVPDKANLGKRKTSVKKKTLNPTFNEILRYRVRMEYLRTQTLILSVWHHGTFGRNSFLGEVDVDLSKWDFDHTQMNYLILKARTIPTLAPSTGRGEMKLAIRFMPQINSSKVKDAPNTGEIHIWVKECKNLPLIRAAIDPYVKCFVLPDTSRKSRQKTRVLRRTADPVFNHTMVYDGIRDADLSEACVELTVWDRDRLASNLLGGLRVGAGTGKSYGALVDWMDSTSNEAALWDRMMASPNQWVEDVLPLRILNATKTALK
ncbi:synaptotagmin-like protein 2 isoform X2 [Mastacembelus armatus]|uniref:synaptotagmin-like protein 2 isoform X2 n=1 Tax=Mastacembelus armatus TaxID=205130 RepID=UPI000E45F4F3|nr:synaptotagmin-like protein 2 isoform X2 [Mastacembelus armatus]